MEKCWIDLKNHALQFEIIWDKIWRQGSLDILTFERTKIEDGTKILNEPKSEHRHFDARKNEILTKLRESG